LEALISLTCAHSYLSAARDASWITELSRRAPDIRATVCHQIEVELFDERRRSAKLRFAVQARFAFCGNSTETK